MANGKMVSFNDFHKTNGGDHATRFEGHSLTRQEFAEECDINSIMKRYEGHGGLNGLGPDPNRVPMFVDFSEMPQDLMGFMKLQMDASAAFMQLPAHVRREFDNDPIVFCDFAADPGNLEVMREWGLAPPAKVTQEAASPAPVAAAAPAPAAPKGSESPPTHGST